MRIMTAADRIAAAFLQFKQSAKPYLTIHCCTKTTAIMGVGAARRLRNVNWLVVRDLVLAWVFTFPGCGLLGYATARLFLRLFG